MNEPIPAICRPPVIDETERARRKSEVDFARGSLRYEGGILSDEIEHPNARYIAGDALTAAILASGTVLS